MSIQEKIPTVLDRERAALTRYVLESDQRRSMLLVLPVSLFVLNVFLAPMLFLIRMSLYERNTRRAFTEATWSIESYHQVFTSQYIHNIAAFSVKFAVVTTIITITSSIVFAYVIWRSNRYVRTLYLSVTILAMFATLVVKAYALLLLISPKGALNQVLLSSQVISEPLVLIGNEIGAILGQVYLVLPYSILVIYGILSTLDEDIFNAATDLGAPKHRALLEVVIPHIVPGIVVSAIISLAWGFGAFTAPSILGGGSEQTFAILVQNILLSRFDWPVAAATSLVMLVVISTMLILMMTLLNRAGGDGEYV